MGIFSGLFGSDESETEIASWLKDPAIEMLQRSVDMGKTGYMPWTGPDVAALNKAQIGAMQNNSNMAGAFGMNSAMPNIPAPTDYGNGMFGYSSAPLYEQNLATLQETRPGQMDYYNSFFVDPTTGVEGSRMNATEATPDYRSDEARRQRAIDDVLYGHLGGMAGESVQSRPATQPASGGIFGGYNGLGDMVNGGGPGQSGDSFGGLLGGFSNAAGKKPGEGLLGGFF